MVIFIRVNTRLGDEEKEKIEKELSKKAGCRVILLDSTFGELIVTKDGD